MDQKVYFTTKGTDSKRILHTPTEFAKNNLLYLQEVGVLHALEGGGMSERENLDSYLCFYVYSGRGTMEYRGKHYELGPGDCIFIDCREHYVHRTAIEDAWDLRWCHFNGHIMEAFYEKYMAKGGYPAFHPAYNTAIYNALTQIYEVAAADDPIQEIRINEKLAALLTCLMNEAQNRPKSALKDENRAKMAEIRNYIEAHYKEKITLESLAEQFYINKYYLTRLFREQYDVTIVTYIMLLRITEAKHLLRFTDMSIESIAPAVGLKDNNYLCRVFKKHEGITPGEYRRNWISYERK